MIELIFKTKWGRIILLVVAAYFLGKWFISIPGYSDGKRTIFLEKFSHKGIFFKTWEGTGILQGFDSDPNDGGLVRKTWEFSVTDPSVIQELDSLQGKKLTLIYKENYYTAFRDGESDYIVTGVQK